MSDLIRRLVSGNKARFNDDDLHIELDLAYITDQVIVMGYPATGLEGFYRNRREDAKRFLEHRHGKNYWVFNFCPIKENSYDASFFDGRVSRYPFPDHHAPPLAILPLIAREMRIWLSGSPDRVAVLHCKAGKGRSGTMACAYLLALDDQPSDPPLDNNYSDKELAEARVEEWLEIMPPDEAGEWTGEETSGGVGSPEIKHEDETESSATGQGEDEARLAQGLETSSPRPVSTVSDVGIDSSSNAVTNKLSNTLQHVLDLHTSRRMKLPPTAASKDKDKAKDPTPHKVKQGVSIPSQRRWLYYWSLLLAREGPPNFWPVSPSPSESKRKVRIVEMKIRMHEPTGMKMGLVRAASAIIDRTSFAKGSAGRTGDGEVWASLSRYDDEFVGMLERWERWTRDEGGDMGRRRKDAGEMEGMEVGRLFEDGRWDRVKMVRSFARLGLVGGDGVRKESDGQEGKNISYTLRPLSDEKWVRVKEKIVEDSNDRTDVESEDNSIDDAVHNSNGTRVTDRGIILDAGRELRVKMYMGQVPMGWFWFIPIFDMSPAPGPIRLVFKKKDLDFPLGIGSSIIDVEVALEWIIASGEAAELGQPPGRTTSAESREGVKREPAGIAATLQAMSASTVGDVVEARQASGD